MSRFTLVDQVPIAPGCCLVCRGYKGPFIDCGFNHQFDNTIPPEWDGGVFICVTCINAMMSAAELSSTAVQDRMSSVYAQGVAEGVRRGKRKFDEFALTFATPDMFTAYFNGERVSVPLDDASEDESGQSGDTKSADQVSEQNVVPDSGEGPDGLSSNRDDGLMDSVFGADEPEPRNQLSL